MFIKRIIISPPFGTYLNFKNSSSVYGSYTLNKRKGLIKQIIKTLRLTKKGVINQIGLKNKGVCNLSPKHKAKDIISIASLHKNDFNNILKILLKLKSNNKLKTNNIELNLSCPNAKVLNITNETLKKYLNNFNIIVKMPPNASLNVYKNLINQGVFVFHISNTLPTTKGGLSGKTLKPINIKTITELKALYNNKICIIAGGGILNYKDLLDYKKAGACYFSLSSVCFNLFKFLKLLFYIHKNSNNLKI